MYYVFIVGVTNRPTGLGCKLVPIIKIDLDCYRSRVHLPPVILDAYKNNSTLSWNTRAVRQVPVYELADLLQWSDLIVYDYITGHYDR